VVVAVAVSAAVCNASVDARLALGLVVVASVEAGTEVLTPWRSFPVIPMALVLVVSGIVASLSLVRDAPATPDTAAVG